MKLRKPLPEFPNYDLGLLRVLEAFGHGGGFAQTGTAGGCAGTDCIM
jgi:hypothetical protein